MRRPLRTISRRQPHDGLQKAPEVHLDQLQPPFALRHQQPIPRLEIPSQRAHDWCVTPTEGSLFRFDRSLPARFTAISLSFGAPGAFKSSG